MRTFDRKQLKRRCGDRIWKLRCRETHGVEYRPRKAAQHPAMGFFSKCPADLLVKLKSIASESDLRGCAVLGFTIDGWHIVSYCAQWMENDYGEALCQYSLQLWKFDLNKPLKKVADTPLFCNKGLPEAKIIVVQTSDEEHFVVCGSMVGGDTVYFTIFSSPIFRGNKSSPLTINVQFGIEEPFPPFNPVLCTSVRGALFFNTGDSVCALVWKFQTDGFALPDKGTHTGLVSNVISSKSMRRDDLIQERELDDLLFALNIEGTNHILIENISKDLSNDQSAINPDNTVLQYKFNADMFVMQFLADPSNLSGYKLLHLRDYQLHMVEVDPSTGDVYCLIAVVVMVMVVTPSSPNEPNKQRQRVIEYSARILCGVNFFQGHAYELWSQSGTMEDWEISDVRVAIAQARAQLNVNKSTSISPAVWSNEEMIRTGKSVPYIRHPKWPTALVL